MFIFINSTENRLYKGCSGFYIRKQVELLFVSEKYKIKKINYSKVQIEYRKTKFKYCKKYIDYQIKKIT